MIEKFLAKLRVRDEVSDAEEAILREMMNPPREVERRTVLVKDHERLTHSIMLLDGLACRFKDLSDGQRQISELQVPGDFVDLHSFTLHRLDHSILTLTPCTIATVHHDKLREITETQPHLTRVLWLMTNIDAAIHREWVLSLGRRNATSHLAHLFCELRARLAVVGMTDAQGGYAMPLNQSELAECLGLSLVHLNRTLQALRKTGLCDLRNGRVTIHDLEGLERLGEFDPVYLVLEREAR